MSRRAPALAALATVTALSLLGATHADARTSPRAAGAKNATSVALFAATNGDFQAVRGLTGYRAHKTALLNVGVRNTNAVAGSVNPVRGKDGLVCIRNHTIHQVDGLRRTPHLRDPGIDALAYTDEGGSGYRMVCHGIAVHGHFALVAGHSQGLLQLRRRHHVWKIDRRVHSRGVNDAGHRHVRGWIDVRDRVTKATMLDSVVIAPEPMPNGRYLALAGAREEPNPLHDSIVLVTGIGTGKPRVRGAIKDDGLSIHDVSFGGRMDFGNGGLVFVPGTSQRAVALTRTGFAVLGLNDLAHPRLQLRTKIDAAVGSPLDPSSLTISKNGKHLAVAVGNRVYGYRDVIKGGKRHMKLQTSFTVSSDSRDAVTDLAYTPDNTLVVLHGSTQSTTDWFLTLVRKVPRGHHKILGSTRTTAPSDVGSLSIWPVPDPS